MVEVHFGEEHSGEGVDVVPVVPVLLSLDRRADKVMHRLAGAIAGSKICDRGLNRCSGVTDDVAMRQLVIDVVHDGSDVTGKMRCEQMRNMLVGSEVCSFGVSACDLLSPRFLSPRLLSPGS